MTTELSADDILKEVESGDFGDENGGAEDIKEEKLDDIISESKKDEDNSAEKILESLPTLKKEKNIVWLKEIGKNDVHIVGGKGANLGEMFNSGFPVPPAFVITASAFNNFIVETKLKEKIMSIISKIDMENTAQLEKEARHIQQMIISQEMPANLGKEILRAYDRLDTTLEVDNSMSRDTSSQIVKLFKTVKEPPFVAVRSSATAEDLKTASFAGQQETFLNIKGHDTLLDAVKKCWASLYTARAIYYRTTKGFRHEDTLIAVVVQKMVNSDKSGVTFSINPVTNNHDEIVIEAVFGLGEGIVSGAIAPDRYVVDKKSMRLTEKHISIKNIAFTRSSAGHTIKSELPADKAREQVAENYEIINLAKYAKKLEDHYGLPQDIEWAIEFGNIYIVQTRAITTTEKNMEKETEVSGNVILEGLAASPGLASGTVKIVNSLEDLPKIKTGDILVTKMTNPDMVVTMQKSKAIVTDEGGQTCHAAIVSREVGLPAVVGTRKATTTLHDGQIITVDAYSGKIYEGDIVGKHATHVDLAAGHELKIEDIQDKENAEKVEDKFEQKNKPKIYMNLGEPYKIHDYKNLPFEGIGLMRLEFMIASQVRRHPLFLIELGQDHRYIETLAEGISEVAKVINPKPIIVRFSDFKTNEYKGLEGGSKYEGEEHNPMIGFRGVSRYISKEFEQAFRLECQAILKAREDYKNIHVMLPFVRTVDEVKKCLNIMKDEGLQRNDEFKIYLMAEVPSMAMIPEQFAEIDIDGASIGSNDLTQLILGVDRDSALLGTMGYFDERNPAVLKAIQNIIHGFHKHGKTVSICGQAPSVYPEYVEFLIKEGIDAISVNPDVVQKVYQQIEEKYK